MRSTGSKSLLNPSVQNPIFLALCVLGAHFSAQTQTKPPANWPSLAPGLIEIQVLSNMKSPGATVFSACVTEKQLKDEVQKEQSDLSKKQCDSPVFSSSGNTYTMTANCKNMPKIGSGIVRTQLTQISSTQIKFVADVLQDGKASMHTEFLKTRKGDCNPQAQANTPKIGGVDLNTFMKQAGVKQGK